MSRGYLIFHLNLAFSSIEAQARPEVIRKCYWPLLRLAESTGIPIGIELTGWTLSEIKQLDSTWIEKFRAMLVAGQLELIGSGWSQLIGPLVPHEVNRWNQQLGLEAYQGILGVVPSIALVNEMAYSTSMIDVYVQAGYRAIIMDRDNIRLVLGLNDAPLSDTPSHALGGGSDYLPVLWSDSILFQRLQRVVHGDIPVTEYQEYLKERRDASGAPLPIYCNDAEIFDYRPGRFATEAQMHSQGEWNRMESVLKGLQHQLGFTWISPSAAVMDIDSQPKRIQKLTSIQQPIPVKKQAKYNINRWALTGRDNLWLNTQCHQIHQTLVAQGNEKAFEWKQLCELWASDLRTHITELRWREALKALQSFQSELDLAGRQDGLPQSDGEETFDSLTQDQGNGVEVSRDSEGIYWTVKTPKVHLTFNARRGLAIQSLAFQSHQFSPLIGTLGQGFFDSIDLGADYYSAGVVIEIPSERKRLTDLEWAQPILEQSESYVRIWATIPMGDFKLVKTITLDKTSESIQLGYSMDAMSRPVGSARFAILTLNAMQFSGPLAVGFRCGGTDREVFQIDSTFDHSQAVSPLVSSTSGIGSSDGKLVVGSRCRALELAWNPAKCAAVPMLIHRENNGKSLTRILFSQSELDDTSKPGGQIVQFDLNIQPTQPFSFAN